MNTDPISIPAPGDYAISLYHPASDSDRFYTVAWKGDYLFRDTPRHGATPVYRTLQDCLRRIADDIDKRNAAVAIDALTASYTARCQLDS